MKTMNFRTLALTSAMVLGILGSGNALAQISASEADSSAQASSNPPAFASRKEALSYAIGVTTARNLLKDGVEFDVDVMLKGMQDAISGKRPQMTEGEIKSAMNSLLTEMRSKMAANRKDAEVINKKKGDEYRDTFAKRAGVVSLPSGVLYKAEKTGTGPKPTMEDMVVVNYRGTLIDGKEFDGTPEGKPTRLQVDKLINGWKEALRLMPVGSRWTIVIPPNLAYGKGGVGVQIGPNETLVFDVDLVGISKAE